MRLDLEGRTAVVTGASSGLGRAAALALGRSGVSVVVAGLEPEGLEETTAMIRADGGKATAVEVDIFGRWVAGEVTAEPLLDPRGERVRV